MSKNRSMIAHRATADRPWQGQRGSNPLALAIQLEKAAAREAATPRHPRLELLDRATPAQILAASMACRGKGHHDPADIDRAWDLLRASVREAAGCPRRAG
jgi:hypothetical protein